MHSSFQIDKSISIPPGKVAKTMYVPIEDIILGCKDPMSIGDVQLKYEFVKQNAPNQSFPCPIGHFREDGRFEITDGRHTYIALIMNGFTHALVACIE